MHDVKTYTAQEAKAEWDRTRLGRRRMLLARVDLRDSDMATKEWDSLDAQERKLAHRALNEDFYAPTWYINSKGVRIYLIPLDTPKRSQADLDWEEGNALWDCMATTDRYSALLANGIGGIDAEQGKFSAWDKLGPAVRDRLLAFIRERNKKREPAAAVTKMPPPREVDSRQMELF